MKKWLGFLLILISFIFVGNSTIFSYAEETEEEIIISTLYPENVLYYQNLDNIDNIAVNDNFIAYNQSSTKLSILNKETKNLIEINNFTNILDFKFVSNHQLIVIDYYNNNGTIKFININNTDNFTLTTIEGITLSSISQIDIFSNNNKILIGYIKTSIGLNPIFELLEIELVEGNPSTPVLKDTYDKLNTTEIPTIKNLVITDTQLFLVFTNKDSQPRLLNRTYGSTTVTTSDIISNIQLLDYYSYNSNNYLIAFTLENLRLLPLNDLESNSTTLTELEISDIDIYNGKIYLAETNEKSITSYVITKDNEDNIFEKDSVLIASKSSALGRFNEVNDIFVQGHTFYVSDTKNNRIQIINDNKVTQINDLLVDSQPHSIQLDDNQNIYFVEKVVSTNTSNIAKYSLDNDNKYVRVADYSTFATDNLGLISDTTITTNNEIFILDYTNNKLLSLNSQTGIQPKLTFDFQLTEFSKIEYIKANNQLAVLNNNVIHLIDIVKLNTDDNPIIDTIAINNCADLTAGLRSIIALSEGKIKCINIDNGIMHTNSKILNQADLSQLSNINYNILTGQIFGFDTITQSIIYFDYTVEEEQLDFEDITINQPISQKPLAITVINNAIIYDLPYNTGNQYTGITSCIGIELYNNSYYRVLFNNNNKLAIGFLNKSNAQISQHNTTAKINVITTNLKVPVYKYPTILKTNNQAIIKEYIPINTSLIISKNCFPVTIDDKLFYVYENNGQIGYIFNADVILNDNSNITALHNNNATIKLIGEDKIYIYDEDKTTIIGTLYNDSRISVENYDKNSEYTLVHFKTDKLTTITGFVKTEHIEMDKMDNNKIVLIIVIIVSIVILIVIIASYLIIKKKKN